MEKKNKNLKGVQSSEIFSIFVQRFCKKGTLFLKAYILLKNSFNWTAVLLFCCFCQMAMAQRDNPFPNPNDPTGLDRDTFPIQDSLPFVRVSDTVRITYIYSGNPSEEFEFSDSLLNQHFQQFDPARQRPLPYAHLGNVGSASRPNVYEGRLRRGFDVGLHQFDIYKRRQEDLKYFTLAPAFTRLFYSQGNDQNDSDVEAIFGRKFDGGMGLTLQYRRLVHSLQDDELELSNNVFYKFQAARHTNVGIGLSFQNKSQRYQSFLSITYNQNRTIDHGGVIQSDSTFALLENGTDNQTSIDIFQSAETASTRHNDTEIAYKHYYRFGGVRDSLGKTSRSFQLAHQISYQKQTYKFADNNVGEAASFYGDLWTDSRGVRHFIRAKMLENEFAINTFRAKSGSVQGQKDLVQVGLLHRANWVHQEPIDTTVQNLFLTGNINFTPNDRLKIKTAAHLGLWNHAGDYLVKGDFYFDAPKLGNMRLYVQQQLHEPSLVETRTFMTEQAVWDNDWNKTLETKIGGTLARPEWQMRVSANYFLLNNFIYFDSTAQPMQYNRAFSIGQLIVQKDFTLGKFHLDNMIALQQNSANDILQLPRFFTKNSLYYEGRLFKKRMLARMGFDLLMNNTYFANAYQPAIGQFYVQNDRSIGWYPAVDVFFSFKVDRFRAFFKVDNLTAVATTKTYYQTSNYPQKEIYFRFGISWTFLDAPLAKKKSELRAGGGRER